MANNKNPKHRHSKESLSLTPRALEILDDIAADCIAAGIKSKKNRSLAADICIRYAKFAKSHGVDILAVRNVVV